MSTTIRLKQWQGIRARRREKAHGKTLPPKKRERKGGEDMRNPPPPEHSNLELQSTRSLEDNLPAVPKGCDWGCKTNSKGKNEQWCGDKLHIGAADCGIVTRPCFPPPPFTTARLQSP